MGYKIIFLPSYSPDLNPIENFWANINVYPYFKNKKEVQTTGLVRTLTELSRAELGMGKILDASKHADEAVNLIIEDEDRNNQDLGNSTDTFLAPDLVKGDALNAQGKQRKL